jgi:hypothetical protein
MTDIKQLTVEMLTSPPIPASHLRMSAPSTTQSQALKLRQPLVHQYSCNTFCVPFVWLCRGVFATHLHLLVPMLAKAQVPNIEPYRMEVVARDTPGEVTACVRTS